MGESKLACELARARFNSQEKKSVQMVKEIGEKADERVKASEERADASSRSDGRRVSDCLRDLGQK